MSFIKPAFAAASIVMLAGCVGESQDPLIQRVENEARATVPAGFEAVEISVGTIDSDGISTRSSVSFELVARASEPVGLVIEEIDGTRIVQPVDSESGTTVTFFGNARLTQSRDAENPDIRVSWRRGSRTMTDAGDFELRPLSTLQPFVLAGTAGAEQLREAQRQRELAEASQAEAVAAAETEARLAAETAEQAARSKARLERQSILEGERLETERLETESRLEVERLRRTTLDDAEPGRWIDGDLFASGFDPLRDVVYEAPVNLEPGVLFGALTAPNLIRSATRYEATVELRVGGRYELDTTPRDRSDDAGTIAGRVLAFRPGEMLVLALPAPKVRQPIDGPQLTQVAFLISERTGPGGEPHATLRIVHTGFGEGAAWDRVRNDYGAFWSSLISTLHNSASTGQIGAGQ